MVHKKGLYTYFWDAMAEPQQGQRAICHVPLHLKNLLGWQSAMTFTRLGDR